MKEITLLSGKGGTGKTTVTAALSSLAKNAIFCDNDVDASDLHLILQPKIQESSIFYSGYKALLNTATCKGCNSCITYCRFEAIKIDANNKYSINPYQCEGCRLCERICPTQSITMVQNQNNFSYISDTRFGTLVHAHMGVGEENSGKLVSFIRRKAKDLAQQNNLDYIINDGPPGIGCATISSLSGTNVVLVVVEPSKSGLHDAMRLVSLIESFNNTVYAIINKFDINLNMVKEIEHFFNDKNIPILAKIPFDKIVVESMIHKQTILEYKPKSLIAQGIRDIWEVIKE